MSGSQRYRAAHKGTGRQTNDTGRRTKGIEGNRNELNAVHIQLCTQYVFASTIPLEQVLKKRTTILKTYLSIKKGRHLFCV